jgi:hypothetical protein
MDKFWEWMNEKGYAYDDGENEDLYIIGSQPEEDMVPIFPNNQMLIGYMIEYCIENNIRFEVSSNYHKSIDKAYNYLLRKIS